MKKVASPSLITPFSPFMMGTENTCTRRSLPGSYPCMAGGLEGGDQENRSELEHFAISSGKRAQKSAPQTRPGAYPETIPPGTAARKARNRILSSDAIGMQTICQPYRLSISPQRFHAGSPSATMRKSAIKSLATKHGREKSRRLFLRVQTAGKFLTTCSRCERGASTSQSLH